MFPGPGSSGVSAVADTHLYLQRPLGNPEIPQTGIADVIIFVPIRVIRG